MNKKPAAATAGKPGAPAGKDKKKLTPAEQAKLDEEIKARQAKRAEEDKKYGIKMGVEGLPLLLTSDFLQAVWESENPRETAVQYLNKQLERLHLLLKIKPEEVKMMANQILMDLIFLRKNLDCPPDKVYLLNNLMFHNFINNDKRFEIEFPLVRETPLDPEQEEEEQAKEAAAAAKHALPELEDGEELDDLRAKVNPSETLKAKSYESDLADFKTLLSKLVKKYPGMFSNKPEIAQIVTHVMNSYFANYHLFHYTAIYTPSEEQLTMQVAVDEPTPIAPLAEATMVAKEATEGEHHEHSQTPENADKNQQKSPEELEAEEKERKRQEEWMGLDDRTIAIIQERLEKTREYMIKKIDSKKDEYNEKLTANKVVLKKK